MPDAFIYDHVRTPRGRGKADGSLHEVTALNLAAQALAAVKERNQLDPTLVDDVVLGCVDPVGEAGGDIARAAALARGLRQRRAGRADQPLLRVGPRRGEFRRRRDHVRPARHDHRRRGRIDEPGRHRRLGRRLADGPLARDQDLFHAAGHFGRSHRHQVRVFARRLRRLCGREPEARGGGVERRPLRPFGDQGQGRERAHAARQGRAHAARRPPCSRWRSSSRRSCRWARWAASTRSPCRRIPRSRRSITCITPAIRPASSTARPPC